MSSPQTTLADYRCWLGIALTVAMSATLIVVWRGPAWVFMWVLALVIFAGFKWLTYYEAMAGGMKAPALTRCLFLFCWPGMSLREFASSPTTIQHPSSPACWAAAAVKTLIGAGLVWLVVPAWPATDWLLRGWVGMVGIILMLHFGTFHLLASTLQACGFNARPNMQAPLRARSLADFWGRRWNTAFNVLADRYGFRMSTPRIGPHGALLVVFLASGVLHEAVITLPACGDYGLPTAYFALQAAGIFLERLPVFRGKPWLKRLLTWVVLIAPLVWLFPPIFVHNVMLPMLHAIGAIGNVP